MSFSKKTTSAVGWAAVLHTIVMGQDQAPPTGPDASGYASCGDMGGKCAEFCRTSDVNSSRILSVTGYEAGPVYSVYGNNPFWLGESYIDEAAVFMGYLAHEEVGLIKITCVPCPAIFPSATRNGWKSQEKIADVVVDHAFMIEKYIPTEKEGEGTWEEDEPNVTPPKTPSGPPVPSPSPQWPTPSPTPSPTPASTELPGSDAESAESTDITDITDTTDSTDTSESTDVTDTSESTDVTDTTESTDRAESTDASSHETGKPAIPMGVIVGLVACLTALLAAIFVQKLKKRQEGSKAAAAASALPPMEMDMDVPLTATEPMVHADDMEVLPAGSTEEDATAASPEAVPTEVSAVPLEATRSESPV